MSDSRPIVTPNNAIRAKPAEIIGPGWCDACGEYVEKLMVINQRGIAGLCSCQKCAGSGWPNNATALLASKYCGKCVHIINIPGNCHIGCANSNAKPTRKTWRGCGIWPLNFDAATVESCGGYSENQSVTRKENPLLELARLLAG